MSRLSRASVVFFAAACVAAGSLSAAIWQGGGADSKWSTAGNWKNGAKPANGEGVTIAGSFSGDIEMDEDYSTAGAQFILNENTDGVTEVRLKGDHTLTLDYGGQALYLYPGRKLVIDGASILSGNDNAGFNIQPGSAVEVKSGKLILAGSTMDGYLSGALTVSGGECRVRRLARYAGSSVLLSGGMLYYKVDNGTLQGTNGFVFVGGTLSTPNIVDGPSFLPVATNQTLIARNTSATSVSAMNVAETFRLSGTLYMTNSYETGKRQILSLGQNPMTIGGRGTIYANCINFSGTGGEYAHFDVAKLRVAKMDRGTWDVRLGTHNGIDFGAYGGDMAKNSGLSWYYNGMVDVDTTDCFDPAIGRTISLDKFYSVMVPGIRARGAGTLSISLSNSLAYDALFTEIGVYEGSTMSFNGGNYSVPQLYADVVKLGENATLEWSGKEIVMRSVTRAAEIDPSAVLNVTDTGTPAAGYRYDVFDAGPWGDVSGLTINAVSLPTGWRIAKSGGVAYLTDDQITDTIPDDPAGNSWYWVGGSGNWSDGTKWNINKNNTDNTHSPGTDSSPNFAGVSGVSITNNTGGTLTLAQMYFMNGTTSLRFCGSPFELTQTYINSSASAINAANAAYAPFIVFETPVSSPKSVVWVSPGRGTLSFLKGFNITGGHFSYCGTVRLAGESEMEGLWPFYRQDAQTRTELVLVTGAVVTVTSQATNFTSKCAFRIGEDAQLKFTGGELVESGEVVHSVHGLIDIDVPYSAYGAKQFYGSGRVDVASTKGHASGAGAMEIGEGLKLYLKSWSTVTANAADSAMTIRLGSAATIGAKADFTYGPAAGVSTSTTAADRALVTEGLYAPLTIDTTDPDTGAGHTITFADPIAAGGDVFVKGSGAVCFASGADSFGYNLSFEPTVTLKLTPAQRESALGAWLPIATAAKIEGEPTTEGDVRVHVVSNADGTQSVECRVRAGMAIIVR